MESLFLHALNAVYVTASIFEYMIKSISQTIFGTGAIIVLGGMAVATT